MNTNRILFVTIPEKGHLNPLIGIAHYLQNSGVEIAFFAQNDVSDQLQNADIHCKCFVSSQSVNIPAEFITQGAEFAEKIQDEIWLDKWIKTLLIDIVPEQIEGIENAINIFNPSVIVTDPMVYASAIIAEKKNIPWVGVSNSLNPITPKNWSCDLVETLNKYHSERISLFTDIDRDVRFSVSDLISPWLNIVFSTEEYIPRELSNNDFSFYVGNPFPLEGKRGDETDFPFYKLSKSKKKVYMSLGSQVYYYPELFKSVAEALKNLNVQLIFSVSELYNENFEKNFPDDSIILPYVPQLDVLKEVDIMVSHGGANSVLECLSKGIPMALLPLCNDQFLQAKFINRAKTGIVLDAYNPNISVYKTELAKLLEDDSIYSINTNLIMESFKKYGGVKQASELICKLLETKEPLRPIISMS